MPKNTPNEPEEPRGEVEIIPPGVETRERSRSRIWISTGSQRVKVVKLGPFGSLVLALALALMLALGFIFLTGVFLVLVPIVAIMGAIAYLTGASGNPFRRLP
jgi:VIT1/CCC1 family predicted Fe2+/Mn2+ transporter